jgi:WD40 repeat protein
VPAVFISYSRRDMDFVRNLHDALTARAYDVWVDWEDIPPSAEWFAEIEAGVRGADGFIYVISPDSVASEVCSRELDHALEQHKRVVPVVWRDPDRGAVPEGAAARNWVFLRDGDDFDAGIETLVSALETDLDHVRTHTQLGVEAEQWQNSGHDSSRLLRGSELTAAEAWLVAGAGKSPEATQTQREFLLASRQAATRRQRAVIGGVTIALAISIVLAIVALVQRSTAIHERNVSLARQLDADAQTNLDIDPELSVLLAVRAAHVQASSETAATLRHALADSMVRRRIDLPASDDAGDVLPSPDGRELLLTGPSRSKGWARIYAPGNQRPLLSVAGPTVRGVSAWDGRGDRFVVGGRRVVVYDARTGRVVFQIAGPAVRAALSPDGTRLVTSDIHGLGHVYDVSTGRQLTVFQPRHRGVATAFALSPNGSYVAQALEVSSSTGVGSTSVDIWSVATGRLVRSIPSESDIASLSFSPDSRQFVYATAPDISSSGGSVSKSVSAEAKPGVLVYDTTGHGGPVITFPGGGSFADFGPNQKFQTLAYADLGDDVVHVYDFYSKRDFPLSGATAAIETLAWDTSGRYLAAAGDDDLTRVYDTTVGGQPIETFAGHAGRIVSLGFADGSGYVATSSDDGTTRLWRGPTPPPAVQRRDAPLGDGGVPTVAFTPAGNRVVVGGGGSRLSPQGRILDAATLRTIATFGVAPGQLLAGDLVSNDGRMIAALAAVPQGSTGGIAGAAIYTFDAGTGARLATIAAGSGRALFNAVLSRDGTEVATLESLGRVELFDSRTGRLRHVLDGVSSPGSALGFSKDGQLLAVAHYPALPAQAPELSTDRPIVVQLWNPSSGKLVRTITGEDLNPQIPGEKNFAPLALAFSPDGRTLAVSGAQTNVQLFSVATGRTIHAPLAIAGLSGGSWPASLAFSPDGTLLAAGSVSGAYVWSVPSYQRLPTFQQTPTELALLDPPALEIHVGFTKDSRELVTYGDNALEVWSVSDHLQVFTTEPTAISAGGVALSGDRIVTTTVGGGVSIYPCDLCGGLSSLLRLAAHRVTRSLTPVERRTYLGSG